MSTNASAVRSGQDPVTAWTARITPSERDEILDTVRAFGINVYSADPYPDVDALAERQGLGRVE
jgi:hypothetical protein